MCLLSGYFAAQCTLGLKCKEKACGSAAHKTSLHFICQDGEPHFSTSSTKSPKTSEKSLVKLLVTCSHISNLLQVSGTYLS